MRDHHATPQDRTPHRARLGTLAAGLLATAGLLLALPAMGSAATAKFGAALGQGGYNPVDSPRKCKWDKAEPCTRLPLFYAEPPPVDGHDYAPHSGVINQIKVVAENAGSMRIQLGEAFSQGQPTGEVESNGPKIHYQGTGQVEKFSVNIPVLKYDSVGFKAKRASTLSCSQPGLESSYQFDPVLQPGGALQVSSWQEECTHLIQARMTY